jgi:biopolymer transport protein ExbD
MAGGASSGFADDDEALVTDINVTPLVDVVLVLLIVFMVTVPAIVGASSLKVDLPESSSGEAEEEKLPLNFTLRREEGGEIALYLNDQRTTEDALRDILSERTSSPEDEPANLAADRGIPYGEVVKILDLLTSMGLTKLSLHTKKIDGP